MKQPLNLVFFLIFSIFSMTAFAKDGNPLPPAFSPNTSDIKMLSTFLIAANGNMADGNRVVFSEQYSNEVDGNDAVKMINPGENFGLKRMTSILAVEARQPITGGDTLFYNMSNLVPQVYKLLIIPENLLAPVINCELVDRFLNTRTFVNLNDTNHFTLQITSNPASRAANRLMVVFTEFSALPLKFTGISAINNGNQTVSVNWTIEQELNTERYDIERSLDGIQFSNLSNTPAIFKTTNGGSYSFLDPAPKNINFYRVRSVDKDGKSSYSVTARASLSVLKATMNLSPNPVTNQNLKLQFEDVTPGNYHIQLLNYKGQVVSTNMIKITGSNFSQMITLPAEISKGLYTLSFFGEAGNIISRSLIVQ